MGLIGTLIQIVMVVLARAFRFLTPLAWKHDILEIELDGEMPEELPQAGFLRRFIKSRMTFRDYLLTIKMAKDDPDLSVVLFHIREPDIGWARAWELRELIKQLRQSGLATAAFLESSDNMSYYIATACDEIFLVPSGYVRIRGLAAEVLFLKKGMDKIGVKAEMAHEGKYKSAHEMFTRTTMSPAHREEVDDILDNLFDHWISSIASGRRLGERRMKTLVNRGTFLADAAKKAGLVDKLCYYDEIDDIFEARLRKRVRKIKLNRYGAYRSIDMPLSHHFKVRRRVALLYATGPITSGSSSDFGPTGRSTGSDSIAKSLRELREDKSVAGVVLRVNSPGGSALASDLIWREMAVSVERGCKDGDERGRKPVVVSMGDVAASGGYYIASNADKVMAGPLTVTGSIGVVGGKFNLAGLVDTVGIKVETVTRGKTADMDNALRAYTPAEKKQLQSEIKSVYKDFVNRVSVGRSVTTRKVERIAKGRVWLGMQAVENGLVDETGGLLAALDEVKKLADIPLSEKVILDLYPKKKNIVRMPFKFGGSSTRIKHYISETMMSLLPDEIRQMAPLVKERGPLAVMPYFLKIR